MIPTFDGGPLLVEAVQSTLTHSYTPIRVIVDDGASTHDTEARVAAFGSAVRYIRLPKNSRGPAKPRNTGIETANGAYAGLLDADDLMASHKVA